MSSFKFIPIHIFAWYFTSSADNLCFIKDIRSYSLKFNKTLNFRMYMIVAIGIVITITGTLNYSLWNIHLHFWYQRRHWYMKILLVDFFWNLAYWFQSFSHFHLLVIFFQIHSTSCKSVWVVRASIYIFKIDYLAFSINIINCVQFL